MATAKLTINGVEADLFTQADLSPRVVKQGYTTELEVAAKGDYTLNLRLPTTPRNRGILKNAGDYQLANGYFDLPSFRAVVSIDGATAIAGRLIVNKRTRTAYECDVVGDNVRFTLDFADKTLRDIQSLPKLRYTGTRFSTFNPFPNQEPDSTGLVELWQEIDSNIRGVRFPLVCYGNFEVPQTDASANPIDPTFPVSESVGEPLTRFILQRLDYPLSQFAFRPAGHVRSILRAMFADAGYQVGGDFFEDALTAELLVPFTDSAGNGPAWNWNLIGQWATELLSQTVTRAVAPPTNPDFEEVATPDTVLKDYSFAWADPANAYIAPVGGTFSATMSFDFTANPQPLPGFALCSVKLQAYRNILNDPANLVAETAAILVGNSAALTFDVTLEVGDTLAFGYEIEQLGGPGPFPYSVTFENVLLSATPTMDSTGNPWPFDLDVAKVLPDIPQDEFVRDLCRLFNLFISVSGNTVRLDSRSAYFLPPGLAIDLTDFADLELADSEPVLSFRDVWLKSGRQDGEELLPQDAGDYRYTNDSQYAIGQQIVEALFAPTPTRQMLIYVPGETPVPIPIAALSTSDDYRTPLGQLSGVDYDYTPRLLTWNGYGPYGTLPEFSPSENCLAFGATTTGPGVGGTNVFSTDSNIPAALPAAVLFNRTGPTRWADWLNTLKRGQRFTLPAYVKPGVFAKLEGRRLIKIGSQLFALEMADNFNPVVDAVCKLTLIKL